MDQAFAYSFVWNLHSPSEGPRTVPSWNAVMDCHTWEGTLTFPPRKLQISVSKTMCWGSPPLCFLLGYKASSSRPLHSNLKIIPSNLKSDCWRAQKREYTGSDLGGALSGPVHLDAWRRLEMLHWNKESFRQQRKWATLPQRDPLKLRKDRFKPACYGARWWETH